MNNHTIARLFSRSAGRCNICGSNVIEAKVKIGEMAHIIAKSPDGPRGRLPFAGDLDAYENLILLCANDHLRVDGDHNSYPPERLLKIKLDHETSVDAKLSVHSKRPQDISGLNHLMRFIPFTQVPSLLTHLPETYFLELAAMSDQFDCFEVDVPHCRPFDDAELERLYSIFVQCFRVLDELIDADVNGISVYGTTLQAGGRQVLKINRDLPWQEKQEAKQRVHEAAGGIEASYRDLLDFLRRNYREVNLNSFCPG